MLNQILIYVLALQDNKYFITEMPIEKGDLINNFAFNKNITELIDFFGQGGYWLQHYPIININNIIDNISYSCDDVVRGYMATYGVHNVRGCNYNNVAYDLDEFNKIVDDVNMYYNEGTYIISDLNSGHCTKKLNSLDECN